MDVEMQSYEDRVAINSVDARQNSDGRFTDQYMVENITIEKPQAGHTYEGYVDNYASPNTRPCDYNLVLRLLNDLGEEKIVHQWHMQANMD